MNKVSTLAKPHGFTNPLTRVNRLRRARYETKKQALTINPHTVFRIEFLHV